MHRLCAVVVIIGSLYFAASAAAQPIVQPKIYIAPPSPPPGTVSPAAAATGGGNTDTSTFIDGGIFLQPYAESQYAFSSRLFQLGILGRPKCTTNPDGTQTCQKNYILTLAVDSNIVDAVSTNLSSIREYLLSQKGSPLALSYPFARFTTKQGTHRQSWVALQPFASFRWVPIPGDDGTASFAGTVGATVELNIEFDATGPATSEDEEPTYPGTLYLSASPSIAGLFGSTIKDTLSTNGEQRSWTAGLEYRVGFSFEGKQPISIGFTGTLSKVGAFNDVGNSFGLTLTKLIGGSR